MANKEQIDYRRAPSRGRWVESVKDFVAETFEELVVRLRASARDRQADAWDEGRRAQAEYQKRLDAAPDGSGVPEPVNPFRMEEDEGGADRSYGSASRIP